MRSALCVLTGLLLLGTGVEARDRAVGIADVQAKAEPREVGGAIPAPQKVMHKQPVYPEMAKLGRVQGTVSLAIVIDKAGSVERASVVKSIPALNDAAIAAVKKWKYTPTVVDGVAVPVTMVVHVNFSI